MIGPHLTHPYPAQPAGCPSARLWFQLLLLLFLLAGLQPLAAQDALLPVFHFRRLSTETGLLSNNVMSQVVRDKNGFIWVGTSGGLDRYDGYSVKHYRNLPDDPHSLSSNIVYALAIDSKDRLWIGTYETGLSVYDSQNDRFVNLCHQGGDSLRHAVEGVCVIREDHSGNLWLGTENAGVICVTMPECDRSADLDSLVRNLRITPYHLGTRRNFCHDLCVWPDGRILVGTDSGIVAIDPASHSTSRLRPQDPGSRLLDSTFIATILADDKGKVWVGTGTQGVFLVDPVTYQSVNYRHREGDSWSIKSNEVHHISPDLRGNLWLSTGKGLDLFSPVTGRTIPFLAFGACPESSYCWWVSTDITGNQWFGTEGDGLFMLSGKSLRYPLFSLPDPKGAPQPFEGIGRDRGSAFWVSSRGKIMNIDFRTLRVLKTIRVFDEREDAHGYEASATYIDTLGDFWYGSNEHGLFRINLSSSRIWNYTYSSHTGPTSSVRSIAPAPDYGLWIGTKMESLLRFDCATGEFRIVHEYSTPYASGVMTARDGTLWISAENDGLVHFDPVSGTIERYSHNPADSLSVSAGYVSRSFEDALGRIWAGAGTVMNCWNPVTQTFIRYPNPTISPVYYVYPLGADSKGRLWIGNDQYISILDASRGTFENLDSRKDLCGGPVDMDTLPDGRIVITGQRGISVLSPDSLSLQRTPPPLVISAMTINNETVSIPPTRNGEGFLDLTFTQNVLEFEFVAADVAAPHLVQYGYQLAGLEKDWTNPKDRRYVRYAGLQPGEYVFKVKASSSRNEWPEQHIALMINIAPPWWRTTSAYAVYMLVLAGLLVTGYRLRLRQIHLRHQMEMEHFQAQHLAEVDRLKSRFFANISHEFRTPLTLILGPIERIRAAVWEESVDSDLSMMQRNAQRLLRLVNQLLDLSKLESGAMALRASRTNIVPVVTGIAYSFESSAGLRHITLRVSSSQEEIEVYFDRDMLEKILGNLLSNAFKYTPEGGIVEVRVGVTSSTRAAAEGRTGQERGRNGQVVEITISDTGSGIPAEHLQHIFDRFFRVDETHRTEGTGIGLALVKELVELHHGTIQVRSQVGSGTEFTVCLPLGRSHLRDDEIMEAPADTESEVQESEAAAFVPQGGETNRAIPQEIVNKEKSVVLVVEDNADVRAFVKGYLTEIYDVPEALNGAEGIEKARELIPDLVISDVMMPVQDGYELCRTLKTDEKTSHIPIILLTAKAATENKLEGLDIGADDYVIKPFEPKELLARVKNLIEGRRRLRERFRVALRPGEIAVPSMEDAFLKRLMAVVEERMSDEQFSVEELAMRLNMGRVQLHRKITALTDHSASEFIRYMRLHRAMDLLTDNAGTVSEIAYLVGFGNPSHFTKRFQEQFGELPSEVRKKTERHEMPRKPTQSN